MDGIINTNTPHRSPAGIVLAGLVISLIVVGGLAGGYLLGRLSDPARLVNDGTAVAVVNGEAITTDVYQREVRLSETKKAISGRPDERVNEAALFNRMIGDMLMRQSAEREKITVDQNAVEGEMASILNRVDITREGMESALADHELTWEFFELSVRDYLTLNAFVSQVLLNDLPAGERQGILQDWMHEQYQQADLHFNQAFLDRINSPPPTAQ